MFQLEKKGTKSDYIYTASGCMPVPDIATRRHLATPRRQGPHHSGISGPRYLWCCVEDGTHERSGCHALLELGAQPEIDDLNDGDK